MSEHKVDDRILTNHEQHFRDLFSGMNALKVESGKYMTMKAGISFFLGTLVTLVIAFMSQNYMQNQTFLEIRQQDQAVVSNYQQKVDTILTKLLEEQSEQRSDLRMVLILQDEVRTKLKLTGQ